MREFVERKGKGERSGGRGEECADGAQRRSCQQQGWGQRWDQQVADGGGGGGGGFPAPIGMGWAEPASPSLCFTCSPLASGSPSPCPPPSSWEPGSQHPRAPRGFGISNLFSPPRRAPEAEQELPRCAAVHESPSVPIIITIITIFIQSLMSASGFQSPFGGSHSPLLITSCALERNG